MAIEKKEVVYPLNMLGVLLDRHVAWIVSRLENLCCLLDYNNMVLNGLTEDNLFVDPVNHQIYLYGGWWFAGFMGSETAGVPITYGEAAGAELTILGFTSTYGSWVSILGATVDLGLVWSISDTCNGLMAIPNLIGVFLLSGTVFRLVKEELGEKQ